MLKLSHTKTILALFCTIFLSSFFVSQHVHAGMGLSTNNPYSYFTLDNYQTQGGVVTKKYYAFIDCGKKLHQGHHCTNKSTSLLHVVNRETCEQTDKKKFGFGYTSGLYNEWGTEKISFVTGSGSSSSVIGCAKITSKGKIDYINKKSCKNPGNFSLSGKQTQGAMAKYNGARFKIFGYGKSDGRVVAKKSGLSDKISKPGIDHEPEDISVDGSTGEVYLVYGQDKSKKKGKIYFYKVKSSFYKKYTGKSGKTSLSGCKGYGKTNSDSSGGGSSSGGGNGGNTYKPYEQPDSPGYDGSLSTVLFGDIKDDNGCGVYDVLNLIIDILTYGIAIAGAIGLGVTGISYLTAKGNEAQIKKSRRRFFEILIGLAVYAILWSILNFLLPGGKLNESPECGTATHKNGLFDQPALNIEGGEGSEGDGGDANEPQDSNDQ